MLMLVFSTMNFAFVLKMAYLYLCRSCISEQNNAQLYWLPGKEKNFTGFYIRYVAEVKHRVKIHAIKSQLEMKLVRNVGSIKRGFANINCIY